jgi:solute:Na+ symporter, SSS family
MTLSTLDLVVLVLLLSATVLIGMYFGRSKKSSVSEYFLGGRSLPWYIAGISMVATTFAADTPLAVTELVGQYGISGNWLWWNLLAGGMLTTVFFARLWRRSGLTTEVEFIEFRYSGRPAALLRAFKSIYLGAFMNILIMGWVNVAMITLLQGFFGLSYLEAFTWTGIALVGVVIYVSFSGLKGVVYTDVFQFVLAMAGSIVLAIYVLQSPEVGGISGLKEALPPETFEFLPSVGNATSSEGSYQITLASFLAFFGMVWWSSWYPGAEPGGGGYSAQRMLATKDERSSFLASALFQIGHYAVRPWPWILVALSAIALYGSKGNPAEDLPDFISYEMLTENVGLERLTQTESSEYNAWLDSWSNVYGEQLPQAVKYNQDYRFGYIFIMRDFMPKGLLGMLLASFFAAYMSTMSTQLNWGASYLINDFYLRFVNPNSPRKKTLNMSKLVTLLLAILGLFVTSMMDSIAGVWQFIMECGAGLGLVLILRWYWWRINAWTEIAATLAPFIGYGIAHTLLHWAFPNSFFFTVCFTTVAWVTTMYLTSHEPFYTLVKFYKTVQPGGAWKPIALKVSEANLHGPSSLMLLLHWILGIAAVYGALFAVGALLFR